jgi:hypothetical protein
MAVLVEEFLQGEEATVTVMPPTAESEGAYWSLPVVTRFNHQDGVAPYNGVVAVTSNSRVVGDKEAAGDKAYEQVQRECQEVARLIKATAPIRIDVRRRSDEKGCPFSLFDINMKPVSVNLVSSSLSPSLSLSGGWGVGIPFADRRRTEHDRPWETWSR